MYWIFVGKKGLSKANIKQLQIRALYAVLQILLPWKTEEKKFWREFLPLQPFYFPRLCMCFSTYHSAVVDLSWQTPAFKKVHSLWFIWTTIKWVYMKLILRSSNETYKWWCNDTQIIQSMKRIGQDKDCVASSKQVRAFNFHKLQEPTSFEREPSVQCGL